MAGLKDYEDAVNAAQADVLAKRGPHEAALQAADVAMKAAAATRDTACLPFHAAYRTAKAAALAATEPAALVYKNARAELDRAIVALENARKEVREDDVRDLRGPAETPAAPQGEGTNAR